MRKLTKSNVEELRKEMPVLTSEEEREVIGGGKLYILSENGVVTFVGSNNSSETIIAIGSVDSGNIIRLSGDTQIYSLDHGGHVITGSSVDKKLFEYLANNTCVEWGMYENSGNNQNGYATINTSNGYRQVDVYDLPNYDTHYHNHENNPYPSEADKNLVKDGYYDNHYIYYEGNGSYISY